MTTMVIQAGIVVSVVAWPMVLGLNGVFKNWPAGQGRKIMSDFQKLNLPELNRNDITIEFKPECREFYKIDAPDGGERISPPYRHRMTFTGTFFTGGSFNEVISLAHVARWKVADIADGEGG